MSPRILVSFVLLLFCGCTGVSEPRDGDALPENNESRVDVTNTEEFRFDFQGHRGCRGLLPENSIPGFLHALDLGVTTLEMDVVITADGKVILSHEPWFSHEICRRQRSPYGKGSEPIDEKDERNHLIYAMTYEETKQYDCGNWGHPKFPEQAPLSVSKPLLSDVIRAADARAAETGRALPFFNIETKSAPQGDGSMHPAPEEFSLLLAETLEELGVADRCIVQSFDVRTLQYFHTHHPEITLALLVENGFSPSENLEILGFTPDIYSPYYHLTDEALVEFCRRQNMKLIPWTVNDAADMRKLIEMGVHGLISDYPDRYTELELFKK